MDHQGRGSGPVASEDPTRLGHSVLGRGDHDFPMVTEGDPDALRLGHVRDLVPEKADLELLENLQEERVGAVAEQRPMPKGVELEVAPGSR